MDSVSGNERYHILNGRGAAARRFVLSPEAEPARRHRPLTVALLDDFDAFYAEHRRCGELDAGVDGDRVWMACSTCGAVTVRRATWTC